MMPAPTVSGEAAGVRLMRSLDYRLSPNVQPLDEAQVAVVCRALADHTAIMAAMEFERLADATNFWPEATSMGRWLHAVADQLEGRLG